MMQLRNTVYEGCGSQYHMLFDSVQISMLTCGFYTLGLLKEYLRELPEPVFSSCLYQMLVDAVGVFLPNDPDGNAKLVFSILDCLPKANRVS
jgi:RhoGAP domain